jgi:hypothetical protein
MQSRAARRRDRLIVSAYAQEAIAGRGCRTAQPPTVVTASPLGSDLFSSVDPVNVLRAGLHCAVADARRDRHRRSA